MSPSPWTHGTLSLWPPTPLIHDLESAQSLRSTEYLSVLLAIGLVVIQGVRFLLGSI